MSWLLTSTYRDYPSMMDLQIVQGSTTVPLPFYLVSSADHLSPVLGATPTVVLSQGGAPFAAPAGTVSEVGDGWYEVSPNAADNGTLGPLLLHATADGADPCDLRYQVVVAAGVAPLIANMAGYPLTFLMVESSDHLTGAVGLNPLPTVTIAKLGQGFATPVGAVYEIGLGWYAVAGNPLDVNAPGPLLLHATASGCDDTDERYAVTGSAAASAAAGYPQALATTVLATQAVLINSGLFSPYTCIISNRPDPFPNPAPPCCAVAMGAVTGVGEDLDGGGRYLPIVDLPLTVRLFVRRTLDEDGQDADLLAHPLYGALPLAEAVIDALLEDILWSALALQLSIRGVKFLGIDPPRQSGKDPMLFEVPVRFSARVMLALHVPYPA